MSSVLGEDMSSDWETEFAEMAKVVRELKSARQWRSGNRTLLREMRLHNNEVYMCRGVAWLLNPDGWHGLGSEFVTGLLNHLGLQSEGAGHTVVTTEETRGDTRADIVFRTQTTTVLVEAKIDAPEGFNQADRLAAGWASEDPVLVFLSRDGADPKTAVESAGKWKTLQWADIASIGYAVIRELGTTAVSPGACDLIASIREGEGGSPVTEDPKLDFYLRRRRSIVEWSDLHDRAVSQLDNSLRTHIDAAVEKGGEDWAVWESLSRSNPLLQLKEPGPQGRIGGFLEIQWRPADLLRPGRKFEWPQLLICSHPDAGAECRSEVDRATKSLEAARGMVADPNRWWVRRLSLAPTDALSDLDAYAQDCVARLFDLWTLVGPALAEAHLRIAAGPKG